MNDPESMSGLTVLFDGGCPLCAREIAHYRGLAHRGTIDWIDVTRESAPWDEWGLSPKEAMARFHVMDGDGRFHVGADGFLLLWSRLAGYRYLAAFCVVVRVRPLLRWAYERFARWHYQRRCPDGQCGIKT